jgi:hypothetical protein
MAFSVCVPVLDLAFSMAVWVKIHRNQLVLLQGTIDPAIRFNITFYAGGWRRFVLMLTFNLAHSGEHYRCRHKKQLKMASASPQFKECHIFSICSSTSCNYYLGENTLNLSLAL